MVKHRLDYLKLSNLRQDEFGDFFVNLKTDLATSELDWSGDSFVQSYIEEILSLTESLEEKRYKPLTSRLAAPLAEADDNRVQSYRALRDAAKAFRYSRKKEEQEAYQLLHRQLKKIPNLTRLGYRAKSTYFFRFINHLSAVRQAIDTLALGSFVDQFLADVDVFEELQHQRFSEIAERESGAQEKLRRAISEGYHDLCAYICLMADHKPQPLYEPLFETFNQQRQDAIAYQRRRAAWKKRKANQQKKEDVE